MARASVRAARRREERPGRGQGPVPAAEPVDPAAVRKPILASWWRSREWNVAADRIELSYLHARPGVHAGPGRRAGAAAPARAAGRPADQHRPDRRRRAGAARLTGDHDLERHLDSIMLAPGFSYAEERRHQRHRDRAGVRRPGPRVRARALRGAPGGHGLRRGADPRPGVRQDRRRHRPDLLAEGRRPADGLPGPVHRRADHPGPRWPRSSRDLRLLQEYTRACRQTGGIVLALGNDVVMLNDHARSVLDPATRPC